LGFAPTVTDLLRTGPALIKPDGPAETVIKRCEEFINDTVRLDHGKQMAHIHLEDGAFAPFWLIVWNLIAAALIGVALLMLKREKVPPSKLAIASMCAAVGFAVFQIELPTPIGPVHMNFTPLIGILIGPELGCIVVLVVNIFSAAIGHGGWGMIGPNSIVNIVEVTLGYYSFRLFRVGIKRSHFWSGFGATVFSLTVSSLLVVRIVGMSEIQGSSLTRAETINNMMVIAALNIATGFIEGIVTGYVVSFLGRVRPDLLVHHSIQKPALTDIEHPAGAV
jgi:cobalt/nickel transport system permease protein